MRKAGLLFWLAVPMAAPAALAGDASGFDPVVIDQCLAAAETQGARADCAAAGMDACLDYARQKYTGDDPDFPMANCLDASHQAWEAKLTVVYQAALEGGEAQETLRRVERSWIDFREILCERAREMGGDLAHGRCIRDETARQAALLTSLAEPQ